MLHWKKVLPLVLGGLLTINIFYMGISYDGKPNKLINIFAILISMINEDVILYLIKKLIGVSPKNE